MIFLKLPQTEIFSKNLENIKNKTDPQIKRKA
jgi:hypothetical protein